MFAGTKCPIGACDSDGAPRDLDRDCRAATVRDREDLRRGRVGN